jgi:acetate kinase
MADIIPSTNSQLSIIDSLQSELSSIKDRMKSGDVKSAVFDTLSSNANKIQGKLDELLNKKGLYTQSDVQDAFTTLQDAKRSQFEADSKKSSDKFYLYLGIAVAVSISIGVFIYFKNKK